ncbi:DUF2505 domain-containing protein [Occultella aeris]|uniref:DUF2505 domain-containing protein n=1 Tax=Occultella aeris TaxID=2761496 RepID=A0A7M4DM24_9MICO|nr:DUF2505 domain-containing protein [Occultella aeris]VZO38356.1 hypothetical protein HALOF300_03192 [Occultella aeris]
MRFDAAIDYPADTTRVARMFADPEFVRRKVEATGATSTAIEVTPGDDGGFTVLTRRSTPTDRIPTALRSFVGASIDVRFVEVWQGADADGRRSGTFTMDVAGAPAGATGTTELEPTGAAGSRVRYDGDAKVNVPFLGAPVERAVVEAVQNVLDAERRVAQEWLTER